MTSRQELAKGYPTPQPKAFQQTTYACPGCGQVVQVTWAGPWWSYSLPRKVICHKCKAHWRVYRPVPSALRGQPPIAYSINTIEGQDNGQ